MTRRIRLISFSRSSKREYADSTYLHSEHHAERWTAILQLGFGTLHGELDREVTRANIH